MILKFNELLKESTELESREEKLEILVKKYQKVDGILYIDLLKRLVQITKH